MEKDKHFLPTSRMIPQAQGDFRAKKTKKPRAAAAGQRGGAAKGNAGRRSKQKVLKTA
ncbi:hypothetical protein CCACVL1_24954 [Corchorus capsularis]|uniref:Uncharacterized protein n=1 Tax=Corchorus capsularis TaxID=210143 RepID=A0A1R3GMD8_COCAP|nr:hypothetical protein CCACVL1_24954 [Corchorus capsularis]